MKIRFRRKSKSEWITLFVLVMPFTFFLLMDILHLPSIVKYVVDIGWIALLLSMLNNKFTFPNLQSKRLAVIAGLFFAVTLVGFLLNYQSFLYYLWGIRNNARFFVFFFACIFFIKERSVDHYLRFFDTLFWINFPIVLYQYFVMGKTWDYLGGIFGVEIGCNAYMNIFMMIIVTKSILLYMNKKEKLSICLLKCAISLLIAALSELKVFILELVVIVIFASFTTKFSFRKLWIIVGTGIGVLVAVQIIAIIFPEFADWFNLKSIWETATSASGYTSSNDMNRLTTISIALDRFLPSVSDKLFGLGLGNCDHASFEFLTTPFYLAYENLNYTWFSSAFLVLETGIVGLSIYVLFFIAIFFAANKRLKSGQGDPLYCQLARIMAIMSLILVIYNASMRLEAAYMIYFVLALPFIRSERTQDQVSAFPKQPIYKKGETISI